MARSVGATAPYAVRPATADSWEAVRTVMGTRGDPSRCWCQYFHLRGADWSTGTAGQFQQRLHDQVTGGPRPPGLLAWDGEEPVGWCQLGPKQAYARLATSRASAAPEDDPDPEGLWSLTCLVVPTAHRRRGVARALVAGAVDHARGAGATALEAYPVDTEAKPTAGSAELYHGVLSTFLAAGFTPVRRPTPTRVVVRRGLG